MILTKAEKLAALEALKCHADEGWHLDGHYADMVGAPSPGDACFTLARKLCTTLHIPLEGRDWIEKSSGD